MFNAFFICSVPITYTLMICMRMFSGQNVHLNTSSNLIINSAGNWTGSVKETKPIQCRLENSHSSSRKHIRWWSTNSRLLKKQKYCIFCSPLWSSDKVGKNIRCHLVIEVKIELFFFEDNLTFHSLHWTTSCYFSSFFQI